MGKCTYIYGIIEEPCPPDFDFTGVEDFTVYTIGYLNLAAVVSEIEQTEVDPTRKNLLAHTKVQDALLTSHTLLPMSFGTIAPDPGGVKKLLENNYLNLEQELKRLSGKIEVELKVFWNREAVNKELADDHKYTRIVSRLKQTSTPVEKQNLLAEAGKLVEKLVMKWQEKIEKDVYSSLKPLAVDACLNNPSGLANILNASFLVEKTRENEFQTEVYQLDALYQDRVNFKYIAPLPPYNFVRVKLKEGENK